MMFFLRFTFGTVLLILAATAVLFAGFVFQTFSLRQREVKTDAIVVLAGGRGRVEEGIRLYRAGQGKMLFLIGVDPAVRKRDLLREEPGESIYLENVSRNTLENALYARYLLARHEVSSIRLITSRYHMKRAVLIFRNVLPKDVAIYPYPVDSRNLKEKWWSHGGSFRLLLTEFYKYSLFRLFFLFGSGELKAMPPPSQG
jgi:uncharacterized SAM-binding protein YcdF (DUF218 family)